MWGYLVKGSSHGARPIHLIITVMRWIRISKLSIKKLFLFQARK